LTSNSLQKFIAVIDDDVELVALFTEALKQLAGYSVFGFTDPEIALKHISAKKDNYVLILSDLKMPRVTGIELIREAKKLKPALATVLMSAFDPNSDPKFVLSVKEQVIDAFLQKPVSLARLVAEIKNELAKVEALNSRDNNRSSESKG
jgi:DNA-binding NtrC family response regulator